MNSLLEVLKNLSLLSRLIEEVKSVYHKIVLRRNVEKLDENLQKGEVEKVRRQLEDEL